MPKVLFHYEVNPVELRKRKTIKRFVLKIFNDQKVVVDRVDYIFVSDDRLLELNRVFLGHNYYTDILTFDLSEVRSSKIAEIYISVDRVRDNATQFSRSIYEELLRVIFHGVLHLTGFNDKSKADRDKMNSMENHYLKEFHNFK